MPGDIILLHMGTINEDYMMDDSWNIKHDRQNVLLFCAIFCLFTSPWRSGKPKFWKIEKKIWSYYHFTHVHYKWQSYGVWYLKYGARRTKYFVILGHFWLFCPTNNAQNHIFEKMKKVPADIIILQMCTINDNYMMYGSWDMERDRRDILSFWSVICPFNPLKTQKIKILKK